MAISKAAGFTSVIAEGVKGYSEGKADRQAAQIRKAEGEAKLAKLKHAKDTNAVNTQMDATDAQNKEILRALQQQTTFRALDAYTSDFDPKHLNNLIKSPMLKDKFKDLVSIDRIDPFNDINLIRNNGGDPALFTDEATKKNASGRYVKGTMSDGRKVVMDMMIIYGGTGYTKYLDKQNLENLLKAAKISKAAKGKDGRTSMLDVDAEAIARAEKNIAEAKAAGKEPSVRDQEVIKLANTKKSGVTAGKLDAADQRTNDLLDKFGGADGFFNTDFSKRENYLKAYNDIAAIEKLEGTQFSAKDKTDLQNISMLIALGDPAAKLTNEQTGLYDSAFLKAKKYVSDNVDGVTAASAYAAFRNTVRHALFGSALTEAEIASFKEAFGTLGQKLGPVLNQFKTALTQVKAKLESISRMNNPYSAQVRLGVDRAKLDNILASIDQRIEAMDELDVGNSEPRPKADLSGLGGPKQ